MHLVGKNEDQEPYVPLHRMEGGTDPGSLLPGWRENEGQHARLRASASSRDIAGVADAFGEALAVRDDVA